MAPIFLGLARDGGREAMREVVSVSCNQPHTYGAAPRQDAKAIMLDFVQPTRTGRRSLGGRWQARFDNAQSGTGTLSQRHGRLIGIEIQRVESVQCGPGPYTKRK